MIFMEFVDVFCNCYQELKDVEFIYIYIEGQVKYVDVFYNELFLINSCFVGVNVCKIVNMCIGDYILVFFSEIYLLFCWGIFFIDVVLIQVLLLDKYGYCFLGIFVDIVLLVVQVVKKVIVQVNLQVLCMYGDGIIYISDIDEFIVVDWFIICYQDCLMMEVEQQIGYYVVGLIEDGVIF